MYVWSGEKLFNVGIVLGKYKSFQGITKNKRSSVLWARRCTCSSSSWCRGQILIVLMSRCTGVKKNIKGGLELLLADSRDGQQVETKVALEI